MYKFHTKPYKHQEKVFNLSKDLESFALFMEMGTGKTKVAIDTLGHLRSEKKISAAVIIAPNGICNNWISEMKIHLEETPDIIYKWDSGRAHTSKHREIRRKLMNGNGCFYVMIVNIEALSTKKAYEFVTDFCKRYPHIMIIDESTTIKSPKAKRTMNVIKLGKFAKFRRILTGMPMTIGPLDLYTQFKFLDPNILGFSSFYSFRSRYAIMEQVHYGSGRGFQKVTGYTNIDDLMKRVQPYSFHITKEECLDLPDKIFEKVEVPMTAEQESLYKAVKEEAILLFDSGELTIDNALKELTKLHQITSGWIKYDNSPVIHTVPSKKIGQLMEIIERTPGKMIIWARYVEDIKVIREHLTTEYGKESLVTYYGETKAEERAKAVEAFQEETGPVRFFLGNPQTGGFGLTLTAARTMIYFSNGFSLEHRAQSEDRAHRIGQHFPVTYIDLVCPGTVDEKVYHALRNKKNVVDSVMNELKE